MWEPRKEANIDTGMPMDIGNFLTDIEEMDEMLRDMIEITVQKLMFFAYQFVESQLAIFFHTFNYTMLYFELFVRSKLRSRMKLD